MSDEAKDLAKLLDYGTFASTLADLEPQNMTDEDRDRLREMFHFISGYVADRKQRDAEIAGLRAENEVLRGVRVEVLNARQEQRNQAAHARWLRELITCAEIQLRQSAIAFKWAFGDEPQSVAERKCIEVADELQAALRGSNREDGT